VLPGEATMLELFSPVPSEKQIVYSIAGIMNMIYAAIRVYR
jgi:hypothetical protein